MTAAARYRPAVPADLTLCLLPSRAATGRGRSAVVALRPAPGRRFWVALVVVGDTGVRVSGRPRSLRDAGRFAARFGIDLHRLDWSPRRHAVSATNPFEEPSATK